MISIVMSICSLLSGQTCRTERLAFADEAASLHTCMLYGQMEMARWALSHPNWSVQRWRCERPAEEAAL